MIILENIHKYYPADEGDLHVLNNINLHIKEGEFVAIMGPSGAGKSTLINLMGFIDRKFQGNYLFEGKSLVNSSDAELSKIRNESVGFVFQNFSLIENNTVLENVEMPLFYYGFSLGETKEYVMKMLEKVGIKDKAEKLPKQLSGGQQQRVAIARSIINHPKFIIADEPTGALDSGTSIEIMELFKELNEQEGVTIILVTHNEELTHYCSRLIRILDGEIIEDKRVVS